MAVTDSAVLAPRVDGVLLVIKPGTTNLAASKQAVEQLQRVGAKVMGVVLNEVEFRRSRYQSYHYKGYYYSYQYYYHENGSRGDARKKNGLPWRREKTGKEAT
jgi:Mrp family chromosome partitioning ATPase